LAGAGALAGTAVMFLWTFLEGPGEWRPVMLAGFALLHHAQAIYFRDARISFLGHAVALAAGAVAGLAHWEEARRALPPLAELPRTGRLAGIPAPLLWTFLPAAVLYFFWWAPAPLLQGARGPGEIALGARIDSRLRAIAASAGWLLIVVLLYTICVASFTSPALSMLALLLVLVAAPRLREPLFAAHGLATALIAGAHLFLVNFSLDERVILGVSLRFLTVLPVLLALIHLRREVGGAPEKPIEIGGRDLVPVWREISGYLTMAVIAALIRFEFPRPLVAALWAAVGLAALWLGMARRDRSIGLAGHLLLLAGGTRGISVNPSLEGSHFGVPLRYLASLPVAVPLLAAGELLRRRPVEGAGPVVAHLARIALTSYPFLFTFFAGAYIYDSVEGAYLTLAWSLEGGAFLALGFFLTNRPLRLSSLGLLIFCLAKALLYDVRGLDPAYRIFSFLALGAVMIGVSFVYARFKHRMGESL
ncbi:MAG: DUF2339 domain-containing protein, partial [Planctomycetota bacterium]